MIELHPFHSPPLGIVSLIAEIAGKAKKDKEVSISSESDRKFELS